MRRKCRWPSPECVAALRALRHAGRDKPVIMLSSTVYPIRALLAQLGGALSSFGWEVWISDHGTMPVDSDESALGSCLQAVKDADAFLGIITGRYGSGRDRYGVSFTHREMQQAIRLGRKRWFLVQQEVMTARSVIRSLSAFTHDLRRRSETSGSLNGNPYFDHMRILDLYDEAVRDGVEHLEERKGNWVQPFRTDEEAMLYVQAQLGRPQALFPQYFAPEYQA